MESFGTNEKTARPTLAIVAATWASRSALPNRALARPAIDFQHLLQRVPSLLRTGRVLAGPISADRSSTASKARCSAAAAMPWVPCAVMLSAASGSGAAACCWARGQGETS